MKKPHSSVLFVILHGLLVSVSGVFSHAETKVLFLGDSLSMGAFGKTLDAEMRGAGLEVYTVVTGGASPYYWLREFNTISCDIGHWVKTPKEESKVRVIKEVPKLEELLKKYDPDLVVVQTGVNLYSTLNSKRMSAEKSQETVEGLIEKMASVATSSGRRLYWITPPTSHIERYSRELQEKMRSITKRIAGKYGRVYDSYAVTKFVDPYPETDGIHYGPAEASAWAAKVAEDLIPYALKGRGSKRKEQSEKKQEEVVEVRRAKIIHPEAAGAVTVELQLVEKSDFKVPTEITYRSALAIYEYEVVKVFKGADYPAKKMRLAHMVVWDRKIQAVRNWKPGKRLIVEVVPLSNYPNLERIQTIDTLPTDLDAPIFIPKM